MKKMTLEEAKKAMEAALSGKARPLSSAELRERGAKHVQGFDGVVIPMGKGKEEDGK